MRKISNWVCESLSEDSSKKQYYLFFTIVFLMVAFCCLFWFIASGKTLIWHIDGWIQHAKALTYYATYLRDILHNLVFNHTLAIPEWDFYIGEGGDIVNTLHYYAIGDPLNLLAIFVPTKYMHIFYSFL